MALGMLVGIAVAIYTATFEAPQPQPALEAQAEAAAAGATPAPTEQLPKTNSHVRMSNVKLLRPPVKKDFAKMAAPEKDEPVDDQSDQQ